MLKSIFAAAAFSAALATTPAIAGDDHGKSTSVVYSDLDLSSQEGQDELEARFARAAREVCDADVQRTGTRLASTETRRCLAQAKKSSKTAIAKILSDNQLGG